MCTLEDVPSVPDFQSIPGVQSVPYVPCFSNDLIFKIDHSRVEHHILGKFDLNV